MLIRLPPLDYQRSKGRSQPWVGAVHDLQMTAVQTQRQSHSWRHTWTWSWLRGSKQACEIASQAPNHAVWISLKSLHDLLMSALQCEPEHPQWHWNSVPLWKVASSNACWATAESLSQGLPCQVSENHELWINGTGSPPWCHALVVWTVHLAGKMPPGWIGKWRTNHIEFDEWATAEGFWK
jgi:hypothetical protein